MKNSIWIIFPLFLALSPSSQAKPALGVQFLEPKQGAIVPKTFKVKMAVHGMDVEPAGEVHPKKGHHHLLIDMGAMKKGLVIPSDQKHYHFGKGQTETELTLAPGKHRLTLQFADGKHESYGPAWSKTIQVTVKDQ